MDIFRIGFHGLIIHAWLNGRAVAVVVAADQHTPLLMVYDSDVIDPPPTLKRRSGSGGVSCYNLLGTVTLNGVSAGSLDRQLLGVPSLTKIVDDPSQVRDEVINQTPSADFSAYVNLQGGVLRVDDFFKTQATFDGISSVCIPRKILYETEGFSQIVLTASQGGENGGSGSITLKPTAATSVGNMEPTGIFQPPTPQEQYDNYLKFFKTATTIQAPLATIACSHPTTANDIGCLGDSNLGVECSNTQYP